ncbi:MAG: hypothetical protein MUC95_04920 [Spirochaetes bacterium]|jgi:hypothetical protein|nr:hypothetical protein [Spirochaetota bacterium]
MRGVHMESLMNKEEREIKQIKKKEHSSKIAEFKKKISDDVYLDHAIKKIAADLSRYLMK